jgi:TadE-like protein
MSARVRELPFAASEDGGIAIEFALIAPALFALILGIVQVGMAIFSGSTVQYVVERVARTAIIDDTVTESDLQTMVNDELADFSDNIKATITYSVDSSGTVPIAHIQTTYVYPVQIPFVPSFDTHFTVDTYLPQPIP